MKRLLATGLLLLLASVPLFAQEKVAIVPPPSADTSAAADAESTSATPGEKPPSRPPKRSPAHYRPNRGKSPN